MSGLVTVIIHLYKTFAAASDGRVVVMGRREGLVTVMLMQFVPPPPTVHQEYTNMMVKIMLTMMIMSLGRNDLHFYLGTAQISIITFRKRKVSLQERKKDIFRNKSTMSSTPHPPGPTPLLL